MGPPRIRKRFPVKRFVLYGVLLLFVPLLLTACWSAAHGWPENWRSADWSPTGMAPDPAAERDAVIQVYAARAGRWKGIFSVHSWIIFKPAGAARYSRYDVVGWGRPVRNNAFPVDGNWYGNTPEVVLDVRGEEARELIDQVVRAIEDYPWSRRGSYRVWPGPNSNTFVAWIGRQVPGLGLEVPSNAIGKDYLGDGLIFSPTPSGSGYQVSVWGLLGAAVGLREGLEIHLLGVTLGIDFDDLALELPGIGSLSLLPG